MAELRAITEENFMDAFNLRLAPGQESFVSHPIQSLAQAYVYRNQCQPFGIYADDKMIEYIKTKPFGDSDRVALTCNKNNPIARKLYESRGFSATGVEDGDELEMVMTITAKRK